MPIFKYRFLRFLILPLVAAGIVGCDKKEVRVYTAPKEVPFEPPSPQETPAPSAPAPAERAVWRPVIKYKLPDGWKDLGPDAANLARFAAGEVSVAVTALMSMAGNEAGLVNMWRQVRGQDPLSDEEAVKVLVNANIGGAAGKMFEFADSDAGKGRRFIVAFVHRPEGSLFFKIQGDDAAVTAQRGAFFEVLKSIEFTAGSAQVPVENPEPAPQIKLPAGWTSVKPGPMQAAKFTVPEKGGANAEVTVSIFPNESGGTLANVKRWRGQIGMPEADDAAILASAKPIEGIEGAVMVEMESAGRALTGAIIPRGGEWYFYKLMGGTPAVTAARESFVGFVKAK